MNKQKHLKELTDEELKNVSGGIVLVGQPFVLPRHGGCPTGYELINGSCHSTSSCSAFNDHHRDGICGPDEVLISGKCCYV